MISQKERSARYRGSKGSSGKRVATGSVRGNYIVRVTKLGYLDYTSLITIESDMAINATQIKTYSVTVKDSATARTIMYADVYLDDVRVGSTDYRYGRLIIKNLTPGPHTFTIKKAGYADNSTSTNVTSDTTITITLTEG